MDHSKNPASAQVDEFVRFGDVKPTSTLRECVYFLRTHRKWWMFLLLVVFSLFGGLLILSNTTAAPFIYTLF